MSASAMADPQLDQEISQFMVRTFKIDRRRRAIVPIITGPRGRRNGRELRAAWLGGTCTAICSRHSIDELPVQGCGCGVYGSTNLAMLRDQYPGLAKRIVAVIAPEGPTLAGPYGVKTSRARIVAYWVAPGPSLDTARAIFADECPTARVYTDCDAMLSDHSIRMTAPPAEAMSREARFPRLSGVLAATSTYATTGYDIARVVLKAVLIPMLLAYVLAAFATDSALDDPRYTSAVARAYVTFVHSGDVLMGAAIASHHVTALLTAVFAVFAAFGTGLGSIRLGGAVVAYRAVRTVAIVVAGVYLTLGVYASLTHRDIPAHVVVAVVLCLVLALAAPAVSIAEWIGSAISERRMHRHHVPAGVVSAGGALLAEQKPTTDES